MFRGEYVEQIPSLVAVACVLPGRAKDLSAPPRMYLIVRNQCRQERGSEVQGFILAPPWNFEMIYIFYV